MPHNTRLPAAEDHQGRLFNTGALVRNKKTGEVFLVRGMYRQDEGPSQVCFANEVEVVEDRPDKMADIVKLIDASRKRGHDRSPIRHDSPEQDGWTIVWGW